MRSIQLHWTRVWPSRRKRECTAIRKSPPGQRQFAVLATRNCQWFAASTQRYLQFGIFKLTACAFLQLRPFERKAARAARTASPSSAPPKGRTRKLRRRSEGCTRDKARSGMDPEACQVRTRIFPRDPLHPLKWTLQVPPRSAQGGMSTSAPPGQRLARASGEDRRTKLAPHACSRKRLTGFVPIAR